MIFSTKGRQARRRIANVGWSTGLLGCDPGTTFLNEPMKRRVFEVLVRL